MVNKTLKNPFIKIPMETGDFLHKGLKKSFFLIRVFFSKRGLMFKWLITLATINVFHNYF